MKRNQKTNFRLTNDQVIDLLLAAFVLLVMALFVDADAATDAGGRQWFGTVAASVCPAADQFVGVQFCQVRRGLPGVWIEGRAGAGRASGFGGVVMPLSWILSIRAGAGVDAPGDRLNVEAAGGIGIAWRRLSCHVGTDSGTRAVSFGAGIAFWR